MTHDLNCSITFYHTYCVIQDNQGGLIEMGYKEAGLYIYSNASNQQKGIFNAHTNLAHIDKMKWQRRLGHLLDEKLRNIHVLDSFSNNKIENCLICPLTKQTRKTFPRSNTKASRLAQFRYLGKIPHPNTQWTCLFFNYCR